MYRPLKFSEVMGQEIAVKLIKNALNANKLPRAIILHGSSGIGKTTLSRLIAAWAVCSEKENNDLCGKCAMCLGVQNGSISDILEFDAASHTSVDDIREILELCNYAPQMGSEKIFIIDEAHMLSRNAIAALLKTLEEAPLHVRFILATTEIEKISSAIKSRCFCVPLKNMEKDSLINYLSFVAKKENIEIDEKSLELIILSAQGSMREALSIFLRAAMLDKKITKKILYELLYYVEEEHIEKICELILSSNFTKLYEFLNELIIERKNISIAVLNQIAIHFKNLYFKTENKKKILKIMIDLNSLLENISKTSLFNETIIIYLCKICYDIRMEQKENV